MTKLRGVAERQQNLVTRQDLERAGLASSSISNWVRSGRLVRKHRGVFALGAFLPSARAERMAAVLAAPDCTAIGGVAALDEWDFTRFSNTQVVLETTGRVRVPVAGTRWGRTTAHASGHTVVRNGMRVTDVPWTISSLGLDMTEYQICHVIHQARLRRLTTLYEIDAVLAQRGRFPGRAVVVAALRAYRAGSAGTRSDLEDTFLEMLTRSGIRIPRINIHVRAGDQEFEVDVPFLDRRLCIEVDGPLHDEPEQQEKDRVRDAALRAAGYTVVRFHWREIRFHPERCERRLRELFS